MKYVLENESEFERLERQSTFPKYDYRKELEGLKPPRNAKILDAGCGSGIVTRYLATSFVDSKVYGCDRAETRVAAARKKAGSLNIRNVEFVAADLAQLPFDDKMFDVIVCRYVLQHLTPDVRTKVLRDLFRCLKPGGVAYLIDFDGAYLNLYPRTPRLDRILNAVENSNVLDLKIGRKIPNLASEAGFEKIAWRIETIASEGEFRLQELELMRDRLANAMPFILQLAGSQSEAEAFREEYLAALEKTDTVLFHNKFIVTAAKRQAARALRVVE